METDSAGLASDADTPLSNDQLDGRELIFVVEKAHRRQRLQRYPNHLKGKRVMVLNIRDDYALMQPGLVALRLRMVGPLRR